MEPVGYDAYPAIDWGKPYLGAELENFQEKKFLNWLSNYD